jgi:tetratricopeptide (TPR) repeat protein
MSNRKPPPRQKRGAERRSDRVDRRSSDPRARRGPPARYEPVHLDDDVVRELKATARPGKGEILVKVFAESAAAFAAGDLPEAIRLVEQAKHIALRAAVVRELLGLAYYRAGEYRSAARELSAFRRLSGSTEQNPVIADCYRALTKPERAVELCNEIDRAVVSEAVFYEGEIVAAGALADMGRIDEAIARLERLELRPQVAREHHLRAWYALADLLERRGRYTQAAEWFDAVESADPELTDAAQRLHRLSRG